MILDTHRIAVGDLAPNVPMPAPDGSLVSVANLRGHPAILAFSAEWDPAWQFQLAHYASMLDEVQFKNLSCSGSICEIESGEGSASFPILHDSREASDAAKAFGVDGGQAVFVLDAEGIVRWKHVAPAGLHPSVSSLRESVKALAKAQLSRRQFLVTAVAASLALAILPSFAMSQAGESALLDGGQTSQAGLTETTISLHVNGENRRVSVDPRTTLLDALRERLALTGTKKGCEHGQCGACTVHIDGRRVNSCLVLAMQAEGSKITTVEGIGRESGGQAVQAAFIEHDGYQCGYCTPGQIMSAAACIAEGHTSKDDEIREWMSGNICRCGAYNGIVEAVREAAGRGLRG